MASLLVSLLAFAAIVTFAMSLAALLTWMERRQSAYAQDRLGPTRAHFMTFRGKPFVLFGLFHVLADGAKMFFKESFMPKGADATLFRVAPIIGFATSLIILCLIPFGPDWVTATSASYPLQVARVDGSMLIALAVGSLGIYGTALAGWASNNRFAMLGAMRAAAQSVSYELALGLTLVGMMIATGSTEFSAVVDAQHGLVFGFLPNWGIVWQPFAAVLFLVAAMAETKRTPFDLPEGESEIIGYFLEYSSMGFGVFMLTEFIEVVVLSCLFVSVFLGGWQLPWFVGDTSSGFIFGSLFGPSAGWARALDGMVVFGVKVFLMCALQLQIRWTLPRFRYDQLMRLGWKNLLPLALANIFVTAVLVYVDPSLALLAIVGVAMVVGFALVVMAGPKRVAQPSHGAH